MHPLLLEADLGGVHELRDDPPVVLQAVVRTLGDEHLESDREIRTVGT